MSLKNAKAYKSGILIDDKNKRTLIVPFQLLLSESYNRNFKFLESLNRQLYHLLFPSANRFTIFFKRSNTNNPIIIVYVYFAAPTLLGLQKLAKQSLQRLKNYLNNIGLIIKIINPENIYNDIMKNTQPQSITEIKTNIHKIVTKTDSSYLSVASLYFPSEQERSDLSVFLRDFYSIINIGQVNLDVSYKVSKKDPIRKNMVGITITIEDTNLMDIVLIQKKLQMLLSIFSDQKDEEEIQNYWFVGRNELLENYGKVILGQGWKSFLVKNEFLNFAAYFNLLLDIH
ncbi:MAG: hypothetical protein FK733_17160 [Asgard group archaeon]|nr:hypothetical protein [Asgard group archaeon]